ncbi:unnamed protein product [Absidia cylindrospora]
MGNIPSKKRKKAIKKCSGSVTSSNQQPRSSQASFITSSSNGGEHTRMASILTETMVDQARQDAQQVQELHYLFKHVFQRNLIAPVTDLLNSPGAQCLDIGCGITATWLIDMANEYPTATFTGIDILEVSPDALSPPSQHLPLHIPTNCHFKKIDVLQDIDLPSGSFDHVYQRFMFTVYQMDESIQRKFMELANLLKPGGYMELIEPDMIPKQAGPKYTLLSNALYTMVKPVDQPLFHGPEIKQCLVSAGLDDVQTDYTSIPICWGGYVGKMLYEALLSLLARLGEVLWASLELEGEYNSQIYNDFLDSAFDECVEYKTYLNFHWAYGKR